MRRLCAVLSAALPLLSGCVAQIRETSTVPQIDIRRLDPTIYPPTEPASVRLMDSIPDREFNVIAQMSAHAAGPVAKLCERLQSEAAALGADAVVNVAREFTAMYGISTCSGSAVRYAASGQGFAAGAASELEASLASDVDKPSYSYPENADDYALVVGIDHYANLPRARFAERDASAMRAHLIALGYPPRNIIILSGPQAGQAALVKYLESWLPRNVNENSRVFFYFSGHGAPDTKSGLAYLVPWDGDAKFLDSTGYPVKSLYRSLNALKAKQVIVAMDSCFSGAGGRSVLAEGARPLVTQVDVGTRELDRLTVFAASAGDEITGTLGEQGHGLFTYYFLKGLEQSKGEATARSLYDFLLPKVRDGARRENREQTPKLMADDLAEKGEQTLK